nr:IS3 family transposase [Actinomyces oris]
MICQYIDSRKEEFGAWPICKVLTGAGVKIAPSTYYARRSRSPSARSLRDEILKAEISKVYKDNYSVLGTRKMHVMLNRPEAAERHGAGHVARCTVERLMGGVRVPGVGRAEWGSAVGCGAWVSRLATFRASIGWRARACRALACVYVAECDGHQPGVCLKSRPQ